MAIPTNIKNLLTGSVVEWARIEFKETWKPEASLKTITAFANDIDNWGGGYIVIGVSEGKGKSRFSVKGIPVNQIDRILKDLLNKCKLIQPEYLPIVAPVDYDNKKLIVIWCPGGQSRPYRSPKTFNYEKGKAIPSKENCYFIRKMANTIIPTETEISDLFSLANKVPFDDRINHQADLSDLNITLIKSYLKEINSALYNEVDQINFEDLCINMGICNTMPEFLKPKNVGLMFFSMEPDKFMPYTQIDVVEFPEGVGGDKIIEKVFKGPLHIQLREALLYIKNSVIKEQIIKCPDKAEADRFFNYPFAAIEEGLANAVYHKGYDVREPIEVRIEKDMIEIISHPGPDRSVTIEGLKNFHVSNRRYRNRRIGEFLKELHLTEGRNTGFKKILNALEKNGSPKPEFETDEDHSYFISRFFIRKEFKNKNGSENVTVNVAENKNGSENVTVNVTENKNGSENVTVNVTEKLIKLLPNYSKPKIRNASTILELIEENSQISRIQLKDNLRVTERTIARYLADLKAAGIIKRIGSDKSGSWQILL